VLQGSGGSTHLVVSSGVHALGVEVHGDLLVTQCAILHLLACLHGGSANK